MVSFAIRRAIDRADVVAVVIDAFDGISHQDEHLVGVAMKAKKGDYSQL